ncbi:hypothetical protein ILUMI_18428 [Ignelater luminosus]|uniref:Uncharacterized protein n=1 Tax=Ignelater luminosus TaxID=2038154 RepID=A0A8K0G0W9_IGNLU|nr:hypothetical protein ILUMI_18428 [Ignelater luminosus]
MNTIKTEYMSVGIILGDLTLENDITVEDVDQYKYLGVTFKSEGKNAAEIHNRIALNRKLIDALNEILWSKNIKRKSKIRIYNSVVKGELTYGSEIWTVTQNDKMEILATDMDVIGRFARISKLEHRVHNYIRHLMEVKKSVVEEIEEKQLKRYGHVQRIDERRLPKQILKCAPPGRSKERWPKKNWDQGIKQSMKERPK